QPKTNTTATKSGMVAPKTQAAATAARLIVLLSASDSCNSWTRNRGTSRTVPSQPDPADVHPFRSSILLRPRDIDILPEDGDTRESSRSGRAGIGNFDGRSGLAVARYTPRAQLCASCGLLGPGDDGRLAVEHRHIHAPDRRAVVNDDGRSERLAGVVGEGDVRPAMFSRRAEPRRGDALATRVELRTVDRTSGDLPAVVV